MLWIVVVPIGISIHALRGEGDGYFAWYLIKQSNISIHALRGEGDVNCKGRRQDDVYFNPRPPWGGRPLPV